MVTQIGLLDYDVLRQRYYYAPNYDLGLTYAYLKEDKNLNVRLISSLSPRNLEMYDKIYVFKQDKYMPHPAGYIADYYKYPIEEYGPGFIEKPLRPYLMETKYMKPDFSCYNNMIMFSLNQPKHRLAWRFDKNAKGAKYEPIRLYEEFEGEELRKDYPTKKYCMIYDDPASIVNDPDKLAYIDELAAKKCHFLFAQTLDISRLNDTNILERVLTDRKYSSLRKRLVASQINANVEWLVDKVVNKQINGRYVIMVKLPIETSTEKCFETLLTMNYYFHKTYYKISMRPMWEKGYLESNDLALLAFRYLTGKPHYMSYYEYVFNISYLRKGVQKELIHTGEDRYEYIFSQYGMSPLLVLLEKWLRVHPQYEEHVFIGGSSNYEEQRRKYYESGRGQIAFRASSNDIG